MVVSLSIEQIFHRLIYLLIFLFPIAGMSLRGWNAYIFTALVIIGLFYLKREREPLCKEERVLLLLFVVAFLIFVISSLVNGWDRLATKALGIESMFLFFVPLYLVIRQFKESGKWLLRGVVVGAIVLGLQGLYELEYLHASRVWGSYGPIIYGSFAVLYAFLIVGTLNFGSRKLLYWLSILLSIGMVLYAAAFAGSRGAYVAIPVLLVALVIFRYRDWRGGVISLVGIIAVLSAYNFSTYVHHRIGQAAANATNYITASPKERLSVGGTAGQRLEMWKAAWLIAKEHPLLGGGRGKYKEATTSYVEQGLVNKKVLTHGHPHNMYLDFLASNGVAGFAVVLAILVYPAIIFYRRRERCRDSSTAGLLFIVAYATFSMFEASTFIKVNFLSTFLVFLAVFFSWHIREVKKADGLD